MSKTKPIEASELQAFVEALALVAQHGWELEARDFASVVDRKAALDAVSKLIHHSVGLRFVTRSVATKLAVAADRQLLLPGSALF